MISRGRLKYVPKIALVELDDIKREDNVYADAEAFRKMVSYARVGREMNRFRDFTYDWKKKAPLPEIYPKKRQKSIFGGF